MKFLYNYESLKINPEFFYGNYLKKTKIYKKRGEHENRSLKTCHSRYLMQLANSTNPVKQIERLKNEFVEIELRHLVVVKDTSESRFIRAGANRFTFRPEETSNLAWKLSRLALTVYIKIATKSKKVAFLCVCEVSNIFNRLNVILLIRLFLAITLLFAIKILYNQRTEKLHEMYRLLKYSYLITDYFGNLYDLQSVYRI